MSEKTRVRNHDSRLIMESLDPTGQVDRWLELPRSLKQPLMAMVGKVANGKVGEVDFPVPGGDTLTVRRVDGGALELVREPVGFPPEGRDLRVELADVPLFVNQVRAI